MPIRQSIRRRRFHNTLGAITSCVLLAVACLDVQTTMAADDPQPVRFTDPIPYGQKPVDYHSPTVNDSVTRLNKKLVSGEVTLEYGSKFGYLPALLEALDVPVASQTLVFSKTALNPQLVGPKNPRAVYFADDVYVGYVPGAAALEVSAIDPVKGGTFYVLHQDPGKKPRLRRESRCLACHAGTTTLHVPGFVVRSFLTDDHGKPLAGYSRITHETALSKRGGGWYVTGTHGKQTHRGNVVGEDQNGRHKRDPSLGGNCRDLGPFFDMAKYPSPHSDIVAHLVLNHQAHGHNLLIRVNHEARLGRRSDAEEQLLRYLLFADEAPLTAQIRGTSRFADGFQSRQPRGPQERSLRQFDLKTRLFRNRLSYLIYSTAFDGLPLDVKNRLYLRLWQTLSAGEPEPPFDTIPAQERRAIIDIVRETKQNLPDCWHKQRNTRAAD